MQQMIAFALLGVAGKLPAGHGHVADAGRLRTGNADGPAHAAQNVAVRGTDLGHLGSAIAAEDE